MKYYFWETEGFLRWCWTDPEHKDYLIAVLASLFYPMTFLITFLVFRSRK